MKSAIAQSKKVSQKSDIGPKYDSFNYLTCLIKWPKLICHPEITLHAVIV